MSSRSENATVSKFFSEFSSFLDLNYSRPDKAEKDRIRNSDIRVRRLDSLARLVTKKNTENCAAVALADNKWYFTANDLSGVKDNIVDLYKGLKKVKKAKGIVVSTRKAKKYLIKNYLSSVTGENTKRRLVRDVKKFLSSLKTTKVFTEKQIAGLFKRRAWLRNRQGLHAEMRLLSYFAYANQTGSRIYLGISKLCCKLCASGVNAFQTTYGMRIFIRGRHGNFYYAWKPTPLLLEKNCLSSFVGERAFRIHEKADKRTKRKIESILLSLENNRTRLDKYFTPQRGGVMLNSVSAAPESTEGSATSEESSSDSISSDSFSNYYLPSEDPDDSSSGED